MSSALPAARQDLLVQCPKRMVYGPCGGVRSDGGCEMYAAPCVFDEPVLGTQAVAPVAVRNVPTVLTDFSAPPFDTTSALQIADLLQPSCDAVLLGEHHNRPDFPPTLLASLLIGAGIRPWITLTCRDRNRVVLEQELRGLAHVGVDTVLCVTGDGRGLDVRPDVTQVFDLDGPRLAALATSLGLSAAVPETLSAPPVHLRARRLAGKQSFGAAVAVLNHARTPAMVQQFLAHARAEGLRIPVIAAVAVYTDAGSAAALQGLPGLEVDPVAAAGVLDSPDPVSAGIRAAVDEARDLLAIDGVVGVNISGVASMQGWLRAAEIKAAVGERILAECR